MHIKRPRRMKVDAFERYVQQGRNAEKYHELIRGQVVKKPVNCAASAMIGHVLFLVHMACYEHHISVHITGAGGGYKIGDERYIPGCAVLLKSRSWNLDEMGYNSVPPDLAIELDFPSFPSTRRILQYKTVNYLSVGTTVWMVFPEKQLVHVYAPGQPPKVIGIDGMLDGGDILPGFTVKVRDIFTAL